MIPRRKAHILPGEFCKALWACQEEKNFSVSCVGRWEEAFARYNGSQFAVSTGSGRLGLELILRALELKQADEVIIPAYTLKDLVGIIQSLGLVAVPADIDNETFNISQESIEKRVTSRTKVILATHLFGAPCEIIKIQEIARKNSIFVIEDCAHAAGAVFQGHKVGSFGDASFFSFETMKPINTYGGGMVVTNSQRLADSIRLISAGFRIDENVPTAKVISTLCETGFLSTPLAYPALYMMASRGWSTYCSAIYRRVQKPAGRKTFSDFQALVGLEKLKSLDERIKARNKKAQTLRESLSDSIKIQSIIPGSLSSYYFFVAIVDSDVWKTRKFLLRRGIDAGIGSEIADDCAMLLGYHDCPNAKKVFERAIQIPLYEDISERAIKYVAKTLSTSVKEK
ncbi:MAG: DegT/DnrJ/EryC1/StrS family aminotransferase [Candidatus Omnitrophica bacterium]|nr:DegT/DnrJ/EryC1/StrS family aminotransferase [Candidatus Omnitrophota bacterium]